MSVTLPQGDVLGKILFDLKSRVDDVRAKAAEDLRHYVISVSRELTGENFTKFLNDVNRRIFELIHSNIDNEKIGGIMAIDKLIEIEGEENATKITRFANYLRMVLPGSDPQAMVLAARALGRLASPGVGGSLTAEFVEFEIKRALEWLQANDRQDSKRHAAVLVIKELASNAPTLIYTYIPTIFDLIWVALRDPKIIIREAAVDALSVCLELLLQRESSVRVQWYNKIYEEAGKGLRVGTSDWVHGSLLVLKELLVHTGKFMDPKYRDLCETLLKLKDHKDGLIRRTVISVIPNLATYDPKEFDVYLSRFMNHLIGMVRKEREKGGGMSFIAIGKIALSVESGMKDFLEEIVKIIRETLTPKGKTRPTNEAPVFQCISMLATAVGPALTKHMHELLELMFYGGLTEPLRQALVDLARYIEPLLGVIQERLLNMLSMILSGQPYRPPGSTVRSSSPVLLVSNMREIQPPDSRDSDTIVLALTTLGSFDFTGHSLSEFIRECVVFYLEDDLPEIRKASAITCCQILSRDPIRFQTSVHSITLVNEVLEKLLVVGISDPDPRIRQTVLLNLGDYFDHHLSQAENVRSIFIALNDEVFTIRELAMSHIGRLALYNPAYVMPSLRKTLIQLLTELEYSSVSREKEESARLLGHLVAASRHLVKPYVEPILAVLLPKARDPSPGVASSVLTALGYLSQVSGDDLIPHLDELLPLIIETLHDQSSNAKREAALKAAGMIAIATGDVIEPYIRYPGLLNVIISILKTETSPSIRKETVKLLGIMGALDPYRHKQMVMTKSDEPSSVDSPTTDLDPSTMMMMGIGPSHDDYYPTVAINSLMKILRDQSLNVHHTSVIQAVMYIFKVLGVKSVPFLGQIMTPFLSMMRTCPSGMLEFHFQQLSLLVSIVKAHIKPYLPDIFSLIEEHSTPQSNFQIPLVNLIESVAIALDGEFKIYLPKLLPFLLSIFDTDQSDKRLTTMKVLHAFITFGSGLEEYLHLIVPSVVKLFERIDVPVHLRKAAVNTIGQLCEKQELRMAVMDTLSALVYQLGTDYAIFVPMINKILVRNKIQHPGYDLLVNKLLKNEPLPQELSFVGDLTCEDPNSNSPDMNSMKKLPVNQLNLKKAWEASQKSTKDDWLDWLRRLSVELLKESPSHALRACASLAAVYYPLARELFNAAFVSCWTGLYDQFQDELVRALETALISPNIPPEVLQTLLNLAEFMEHDDKALPIDIRTLGAYAIKCQAYAKALHYKELEFINDTSSTNAIEALISINNSLQQPDAAIGILTFAQQNHEVSLKESWYIKLQRWEDGLAAYERKQKEDPQNFEVTMGIMKCLHQLGEWERLSNLGKAKWSSCNDEEKKLVAPLAAAAEWGLGQWECMDEYISVMKTESPDGSFFRAILALHRNLFDQAEHYIDKARELLDTEFTALVSESYNRSYIVVVRVQMLAELEEIMAYKKFHDQPERQMAIRRTWNNRLKGCQRNVEVWNRILKVRSVVLSPREDMDMWIKFTSLCRKSGRWRLSYKTLTTLLGFDPAQHDTNTLIQAAPPVVYAYLKHMWETGGREQSFALLGQFTQRLSETLGGSTMRDGLLLDAVHFKGELANHARLLARCYFKLGEWQMAIQDEWSEESISEIIRAYLLATHFDRNWYKAWHSWALANFEVISFYERHNEHVPNQILSNHIVPSVQGFFRSIALSSGDSLQDTLRLLTLWFKYGHQQDVNMAISEGFNNVPIDTWLHVIPQLIARIHAPSPHVRRTIHQLLTDVGKEHPQALIYSLMVASKSTSTARKKSALAILDKMRMHRAALVEQGLLVSQELIRVAILWHEMWHEGLEEASRQFFGENNVEAMFATLEPLHQMLEKGPETLREISFHQAFGRDLQEALEWCRKYRLTLDREDLNQAWDLYFQVFRRINKQLPQLTTLELQYVSPKLLAARDLELAVPGSYKSGEPIVRIASFASTLSVITSKQRPRKLTIKGSDGKDYQYLLKGHEDLRQDERVMQLFGLVNNLLGTDPETFKSHLNIQRYPVIPLSPNSGLIGWVPHCDTLHALIKDFRESRKILLNIEHRLMLQMAPDYDNLTLMQKIEVFEYALENTTGQDLYKVLWLKSRSSEAWLDRRTNYTRSLAVMSMVGYVLGLGDRHPSNLMLDRYTGKVIHIDFGDCFEVAMHREKFPERIPFRLTRMLINAMEVSGIEGSFRITCENVMRVLRENKDSLMAVLEAFVYDPLINWRLMTNASPRQEGHKAFTAAKKLQRDENDILPGLTNSVSLSEEDQSFNKPEALNSRAVNVINRVSNKLTGRDFKPNSVLDVPQQVDRLILQATSLENLCQCYIGW
ncbi:armadillo-type protein [Paraphysoderma sedebokerense]|nr:armadillo-type protein [Paraphysoderma sedebokerense]